MLFQDFLNTAADTIHAKADSTQLLVSEVIDEAIHGKIGIDKIEDLGQQMLNGAISAGGNILKGIVVFIIGRFIINMLQKLVRKMLDKRDIDVSVKTFTMSMVKISLTVLLIISVIGALGLETTSFAALLASAGVAIGMALSGNLQNFAGGLVILLFKPYRVGEWIECQGVSGTVKEIQIFHTILLTADNKTIFIPNGALSSGVVTNYTNQNIRRVEWIVGVEYGEDYDKVEKVIKEIIAADDRILQDPTPFIALQALDSSSVNIMTRCWVKSENYWPVYFEINKKIYQTFNDKGIGFPFPQITVHQAAN